MGVYAGQGQTHYAFARMQTWIMSTLALAARGLPSSEMGAVHAALCAQLAYDKRPSGNRGRCLAYDFPALSLKARDRIEPSSDIPDAADLENCNLFYAAMI